jgi:hypothetical protein
MRNRIVGFTLSHAIHAFDSLVTEELLSIKARVWGLALYVIISMNFDGTMASPFTSLWTVSDADAET